MSTGTSEAIVQTGPVATPRETVRPTLPPQRNVAVDAYRGLVMVLMMGEVMRFAEMARAFPNSTFWSVLGYNQTHVEWAGMSLHDTIQPGFTFLAGVALPYSIGSRQRKGESFAHMLFHTMWRSLVLVALGIFLRSTDRPITYFTFEDTLTQIGLGYTFAFLLSFVKARWQWIAPGAILFGYWHGRCIRLPERTSIGLRLAFRRTGTVISTRDLLRTGIKTAILDKRSMCGT